MDKKKHYTVLVRLELSFVSPSCEDIPETSQRCTEVRNSL